MQVKEYAKLFDCSEVYIRKSLSELVKNDFLVRVERCNYLANPDTFYVGGSKLRGDKRVQYLKYKAVEEVEGGNIGGLLRKK